MCEIWKCKEGKRIGYCPFLVLCHDREFSVAIEIAEFMSRQKVLYHDKVEYWQASWVATGQCVSR